MTEILLFHHALGLTPGVTALADRLRAAGHTVHTPDLYDGKTFATVAEGVDHARSIGFGTLVQRGTAIAADLPEALVYAGISMGVMPAQNLAQNRAGAKGAVFFESSVPAEEFGGPWPAGVPLQIHAMDADPEFVDSGDIDAGRELVAAADDGGAVPLSRRPAPVHRREHPVVRRGGDGARDHACAGVSARADVPPSSSCRRRP